MSVERVMVMVSFVDHLEAPEAPLSLPLPLDVDAVEWLGLGGRQSFFAVVRRFAPALLVAV